LIPFSGRGLVTERRQDAKTVAVATTLTIVSTHKNPKQCGHHFQMNKCQRRYNTEMVATLLGILVG
jgi:hypothetical protein